MARKAEIPSFTHSASRSDGEVLLRREVVAVTPPPETGGDGLFEVKCRLRGRAAAHARAAAPMRAVLRLVAGIFLCIAVGAVALGATAKVRSVARSVVR